MEKRTIKSLDKEFKELAAVLSRHFDKTNIEKIKKAWEFAKLAHISQKRKTGDPYISHVLDTAKYLADWKLDANSIIAGLLHDTVEDGGATREDLVKEFGDNVTDLVDGVTKVSSLRLRGSADDEFVENLRKMFFAMAKDLRVVLIKLADRLHNMETLFALPDEKRLRISRETIEVFAPLAERLGMGEVKSKLDDLAFPYVFPEEYKKLNKESKKHYRQAASHIKKMKRSLLKRLANEGIRGKVQARAKHLYSLWRKLERPEIKWDFNQIHDIVALRILAFGQPGGNLPLQPPEP